ncbi:PDZ domain-containing protein [Pseudomonadota bacterium]
MTRLAALILIPMLMLAPAPVTAAEDDQRLQQEQASAERQAMLQEAEQARLEAEAMRQEARKTAVMVRESTTRLRAERARERSESNRAVSEERARELAIEQEELARTREELSRAHRELREATREVAQAHRDLSQVSRVHATVRHVNLGDRAVIGVVLGSQTDSGIKIIGISPDGPAERAGLQQGDTLVSIGGVELADNDEGREAVFEVMSETSDGEELPVIAERDGETLEFVVTAQVREPRGWQSVIRIPEIELTEDVSGSQQIIVERIEVPDIDEEELAIRVAEISARVSADVSTRMDGEHIEHFEIESFSDLGGHAMREANIWFGLPHAHGLELATVNESLGSYFKTDRGVLVISAKEDNAYELQSGDVILAIGSTTVNSPSDMMRALRDAEPGQEIILEIKRDRRDRTLTVVMPENRLGLR